MSNTLTDILRERLAGTELMLEGNPPSLAHFLVGALLLKASKGDVPALALIWEKMNDPTTKAQSVG